MADSRRSTGSAANGVAESFFKTIEEQLLRVRDFATVEELRLALLEFQRNDNESWILERHDYRAPNQERAALVVAA